jgi:hypothetical protein
MYSSSGLNLFLAHSHRTTKTEKTQVSSATTLADVGVLTETAAQRLSPAYRRRMIHFVEYASLTLEPTVFLHVYTCL